MLDVGPLDVVAFAIVSSDEEEASLPENVAFPVESATFPLVPSWFSDCVEDVAAGFNVVALSALITDRHPVGRSIV